MTLNWAAGAGRVQAAGHELEWQCWGPDPQDAPTLVLLHEGLGSIALWRDLPDRLTKATGWGVFAYSRAGYGRSDPVTLPRPLDYMTQEALAPLPDVLTALAPRRAVLVGHSDGATIAALHLGLAPDPRVIGGVLMAPHTFTEDIALRSIAGARDIYLTGGLRDRMTRYHDHPDVAFFGWCDAWSDPGFRDWDVRAAIDGITCPLLVLQGTDDQYGSAEQVDVFARRSRGPVETAMVPDCRHSPHLDQPEAVVQAIAGFCAGLADG